MSGTDWLFLLFIVVINLMSVFVMLGDCEKNHLLPLSKKEIVYLVIMLVINVAIGVLLRTRYSEDTYLFQSKRMCLLSILWAVAFVDYKSYRVPNQFVLIGIGYRMVILFLELILGEQRLIPVIVSDLIPCVCLLIAAFLCRRLIKNSIGLGDIKLFFIMGLLLSTEGIWNAIFVSLIVSLVISVVLLATKKKSKKDAIPFGPAIAIGTYLSVILSGM